MATFFLYFLITALLLCSALFSGITYGVLRMSRFELKKRAQGGDADAKKVYPLRALDHQLTITLLFGNVLVTATIVLLLSIVLPSFVALMLAVLLVGVFGEILPMLYLPKYALKLAAFFAPALKYMVIGFGPIAKPLARLVDSKASPVTSLYSKQELLDVLEAHKSSVFSDIEAEEIEIVTHALSFGEKQVRDIMTPRKVVVRVATTDAVGPILIDELHASGHSRFPVYDAENNERFVGTLFLHDLVGLKKSGVVSQVMRQEVYYMHEEEQLAHALHAFLKTNHHLFVVVNTFEEFVGVVSIEDVLEQILGRQIVDEFDQYADLRAVARSMADKERAHRVQKQAKQPKK
jgi:metal transporter CNNM